MSSVKYVVFTRAKNMGWIRRFLHKDISHCFVMWPDKDRWLVYDHSISHIGIFTVDNYNDILDNSIVIKVDREQVGWTIGLNTCVSAVKKIIGVNNLFILTPFQLFKRLVKWGY